MTALGVSFEGRESPEQSQAMIDAAEEKGVSTLWMACHLYQREPIARATIALARTKRVRIGLMAMSPYSVHPIYAAMAAATLDELFPGRVLLCLGAGAPRDLEAAGLSATRPLRTMRESIDICRSLLAGDTIQHEGQVFTAIGRRLMTGARDVPVLLAASGPQMLELAGEIADGVMISAGTSVEFVRWCIEVVAQGEAKSGRRTRRIALMHGAVAEREEEAHAKLRRTMAFILRGPHHARNLQLAGSALDQDRLARAFAHEQWAEVEALVTDDIIRRHAVSGTPQQARARIDAYRAVGLDEIVFAGQGEPERLRSMLSAI